MSMSASSDKGLENEINVTPMIDVLLVLLIIFMAALPSMRKAIDVQLPDPTPSVQPINAKSDQIVLEINPGGKYFINSQPVDSVNLNAELHKVFDNRNDKILFIKGNEKAKFGAIVAAMDVSRGAGVKVLGVPPRELGKD